MNKVVQSIKNNEKSKNFELSIEKISKSPITFRKNKANLSEDKIGAKHFSKRIYERFHPLVERKNKPNQTQFKANTNPIYVNAVIGLSSFMTSKYVKFDDSAAKKQTQFKPKQTQSQRSAVQNFET